jgi:hypothetical protein
MQTIQEKKQLTFEEIAPLWYQYLTGPIKSRDLEITDFSRCIVGEAHGFSSKSTKCEECHGFGLLFCGIDAQRNMVGLLSAEEVNNDNDVKEFVQQWNEVHKK